MDMDFRILEQLTQIFGPSGSEEQVAEFISAQISPYCDEVISDTLGNLLAVRHGTGKKSWLLLIWMKSA